MSDNTLNKALLIKICDCPRRRLLRALEGVDRMAGIELDGPAIDLWALPLMAAMIGFPNRAMA